MRVKESEQIMALGKIAEAFSLSHAQIIDGSTSFLDAVAAAAAEDEDIYGVNEASLEPDTDSYDNEGDDAVLSTWSWLNSADISVQAGYLSFPLIAKLSGQTVTTTQEGTGEDTKTVHSLDLWHEDSFNVAPHPMIVKMPSRDADGSPATLVIGLYRVFFEPIGFDGPAYKDGLKVNYNGKAVFSASDETGEPFSDAKKRVGRLLLIER